MRDSRHPLDQNFRMPLREPRRVPASFQTEQMGGSSLMIAKRSVSSVVMMMVGAAIFGGDPSRFGGLGIGEIPGYMVCGGAIFATGAVLRFRKSVRSSDRVIAIESREAGRGFARLNC